MMGTGDFAVPTFESLYSTPHQVVGLYTQPDRSGRGHHQGAQNPMKAMALERGTSVFQPDNINSPEGLLSLRRLDADLFVVAAYGQILSPELLSIPHRGSINVHASLLPKYRGASPIATAILNGETETGVSIIQILPRLDSGPILAVARTQIGDQETAGQLEDRLARMAVELVPGVIEQIACDRVTPLPQTESLVTRAKKLTKTMGAIDWTRTATQIDCQIRAMQPWPNPYTFLYTADRPPLRVLIPAVKPLPDYPFAPTSPGRPVVIEKDRLIIAAGRGAVEILRIQPDGKRPMSVAEFLRGRAVTMSDHFGPESSVAESPAPIQQ
jgi:methionyl-tRNA formyltransferase